MTLTAVTKAPALTLRLQHFHRDSVSAIKAGLEKPALVVSEKNRTNK